MSESTAELTDVADVVRRLPLFDELKPELLQPVVMGATTRRLAKGEILFQRGDRPDGFFVVMSGQVKLGFLSAQGHEKVLELVGARQSFGEALMFMDRPYPVFAQGAVDSLLLHVPRVAVMELLRTDQSFARGMLAGLAKRLQSLVQDVESYSLRSSAQRLVGYLLRHCPDEHAGPLELQLPAPKALIASRLTLTPETLSRVLHELGEQGLIEVHGKAIGIPDIQRLRDYGL
jgi:CRP-like cAMP-binding protein